MTLPVRRILLQPESVRLLVKRVVGRGGFQSLLRRLQAGLHGSVLTATVPDLERLVRHCGGARVGGFQRRARAIVVDDQLNELISEGMLPVRMLFTQGRGTLTAEQARQELNQPPPLRLVAGGARG